MNIVKRIRKKKGWSVKKMAYYLGVSPRTVEGFEQGKRVRQTYINLLNKIKVDYDKES